MKEAEEICLTATMEKIKAGALMIDVRNESEVVDVRFDVPNYVNIPLNELENRINEIPKETEIIMVCRSGARSLKTTYFLMNAGYEKIYNMNGGLLKWIAKGFPTKGNVDKLLNSSSCDCSQPNCC